MARMSSPLSIEGTNKESLSDGIQEKPESTSSLTSDEMTEFKVNQEFEKGKQLLLD